MSARFVKFAMVALLVGSLAQAAPTSRRSEPIADAPATATCYLVSPVSGRMVKCPTDGIVHADENASRAEQVIHSAPVTTLQRSDGSCGGVSILDRQGQPIAVGSSGTLNTTYAHTASLNDSGQLAFLAGIDGLPQNQGIFVADAEGLHAIALGCGDEGGTGDYSDCGDPTPLGGTFGGFFLAAAGTPAINDRGDVLFLADIYGGTAPRGLFLYRSETGVISTVAAVGQSVNGGEALLTVGMGTLSNADTVVFLASAYDDNGKSDIYIWRDDALSKYAGIGDPSPGGGVFYLLGAEAWHMPDGSWLPDGPIPAVNDAEQIVYVAYVQGDVLSGGILLDTEGNQSWQVRYLDPAPGGGAYTHIWAAHVNNLGEIAFYSDLDQAPGGGWYAGRAGQWRKVVAFSDVLAGGNVRSLAVSRNPQRAIADNGDIVLWAGRRFTGENIYDTNILFHPDGTYAIVAAQNQPSPVGGTWGPLGAWPLLNDAGQMLLSSRMSAFDSAHVDLLFDVCEGDGIFRSGFDQ